MTEFMLWGLQAQLYHQLGDSHAVFLLVAALLLLASGVHQQSLSPQSLGCITLISPSIFVW